VGAIAGKPLVGLISDWFGGIRKIPIIICLLSFCGMLLVFGVLTTELQFQLAAPFLGVVAFVYSPLLGAMVTEVAGLRRAGSATGITAGLWQMGSVIVPVAVGREPRRGAERSGWLRWSSSHGSVPCRTTKGTPWEFRRTKKAHGAAVAYGAFEQIRRTSKKQEAPMCTEASATRASSKSRCCSRKRTGRLSDGRLAPVRSRGGGYSHKDVRAQGANGGGALSVRNIITINSTTRSLYIRTSFSSRIDVC
jgi:hypothetical protein